MIKNIQNCNKKIVIYLLCSFLILSVLFITSGCSDGTLHYKPEQVKAYSKATLADLYRVFTKDTKESKKYLKAKDSNYKSFISATALRKNDLHTLVVICKKDPTSLNKAYVYACGWNTQYDKANQSNYAVCLVYYRDRFTKKEQKMVSSPLEKVIESCIHDPTGESQKDDDDHRLNNDNTLVNLYMGLALLYDNEGEEEENSFRSNNEKESEKTESEESEKESGSNSSEEATPSKSEPTESEPTESTPSEPNKP